MDITTSEEQIFLKFDNALEELESATSLGKPQKASKLLSIVDLLSRSNKGITHLYDHAARFSESGFFQNTPWEDPGKQVPALVKGTLLSGHPNANYEIVSELRMLSIAAGQHEEAEVSQSEAKSFIEEVIVQNLEFAFDELTEESRSRLNQQERHKIVNHFRHLLHIADLSGIKDKLAQEIRMVCEQRPVITTSIRNLIQTVYQKFDLDDSNATDVRLNYFVRAIYFPGPLSTIHSNFTEYSKALSEADESTLAQEAKGLGEYLQDTGLTNPYLGIMLRFAVSERHELLPHLLHLSPKGVSEWERHIEFLKEWILLNFNQYNYRGIFGLKRMMEQNMFSREAVRSGLMNLKLVNMHPHVERQILKSIMNPTVEVTAKSYLLGALTAILGQPLGVGQGNNVTCQSARGISLWAQHSPAKLINMITTVATSNNLIMRFENDDLESIKLSKGLVDELDYKLDAVSVILVPHLDKIYNEMMRRASGRGEDPHKWVNPALYGHWIPTGFASAYSYITLTIQDHDGFTRLFFASFHPKHNGGRSLVYPNPVGIFVTSSKAEMLGFHAVSLLRIDVNPESEHREYRAYFLNPNNEGRQDWGQNIKPSVYGNGEKHGESSLPVDQFVSRLYAYHYNPLDGRESLKHIPDELIRGIGRLARESWGKKYTWSELKREW